MALVLKSKVTRSTDGLLLYIEVYEATGLYNVTTNPGGWGSPNPARNTLALIFDGNHKRVDGDILAVPDANDPVTVQSFTLHLPGKNGALNYQVYAVEIFDTMGTYADGDIVWDNQNPSAPFLKKRVSGVWTVIVAADILGDDTVVQIDKYAYPIPEMEAYRNGLNTARLELLREKEENGDDQESDYDTIRNEFDFVDGLLDASGQDFCAAAYNEAQVKLERVEDFAANHPLS